MALNQERNVLSGIYDLLQSDAKQLEVGNILMKPPVGDQKKGIRLVDGLI